MVAEGRRKEEERLASEECSLRKSFVNMFVVPYSKIESTRDGFMMAKKKIKIIEIPGK